MSDRKKGTLIPMSSAAKKTEVDIDFDAEKMLMDAYAEIRAIRNSKSPSFQMRKLVKTTGESEHLRTIFENAHQSTAKRKTKA